MPLRPGVQRLVQEAVAAGETKACAFFLVVLGCTVGILRGQLVAAGAAMLWPRVKRLVEEAVAAGGFASRVVLGAPIAFSRVQLVETGAMPLRPGVKRLAEGAVAAGEALHVFWVVLGGTVGARGGGVQLVASATAAARSEAAGTGGSSCRWVLCKFFCF
jgi:hypothetical protein